MTSQPLFKNLKSDIPASIVVFFVALPLCLGIALASGAPLFAGLIAGIVGGTFVGIISKSQIGVSGPAAGLAAIVLASISDLGGLEGGGYEKFLAAVVIGGVIQIIFGVFRLGIIGYFFPSSVIKGMLSGIGLIIIMKQIPYFFGMPKEVVEAKGLFGSFGSISVGATLIAAIGIGLLLLWSNVLSKKAKIFTLIQGPLVVVVVGILFYLVTKSSGIALDPKAHLVQVPVPDDFGSFLGQFSFPNFSALSEPKVWIVGFTIALVASLETLLCVEATDKLDPDKRVTPTNRELFAQGTGNLFSGMIGGLPITQVIVRSSANVQSGGKTKLSAILHGFFLLLSVILIPGLLNNIPLSILASILLIVGYKLASPANFIKMFKLGWKQFVPFLATVLPMVLHKGDLLLGIACGLAVAIVIILWKSFKNSHFLHMETTPEGKDHVKMTLAEEVTFFNKGAILKALDVLKEDSFLELDITNTRYLENDIVEILEDFSEKARLRNIEVSIISEDGVVKNPDSMIDYFKLRTDIA